MAVYPNEQWPSDLDVRQLDGSTDAATGLPYVPKGVSPTSEPTYEVQYNRREQRLLQEIAPINQGRLVDEGDLNVGVYPIDFTIGGERKSFGGASGHAVTDDATTYVWLDSTPSLQTGAAYPADVSTYLPLAKVVAASGVLTITDARPKAIFTVGGGSGGSGDGTTSQTFQIDSDASGPKLKNNAGELQIRNAGDDDDANLKAGTINAVDGFQANGSPLAVTDLTQNGTGTTTSQFQIDSDNTGPRLRNTGGTLQVRNAADNDDANLQAGTVNAVDGFQKNGAALAVTDVTQNGTGTTESSFQIDSGNNGPRLRNVQGELQVRTGSDNDDSNLKVGTINAVDGYQLNGSDLTLDGVADGVTYGRVTSANQLNAGVIVGTPNTTLQIDADNGGPLLKNNSGDLVLRNAGDTGNASLTAAGASFTGNTTFVYAARISNDAWLQSSGGRLRIADASSGGNDRDLLAREATLSAGTAAGLAALRFGASLTEGLEVKVIDETVATSSGTAVDLTSDVPAGAVILSAQANIESAVSGPTAVGIGVSGDPDKYGETSGVTQNLKIDTIPDWSVLSGAEDIQVMATDGAGGTGSAFTGGSVRVRITYLACNSLDDAA
jgi:hypothetical protein